MPVILSVAEAIPPFSVNQNEVKEFAENLFAESSNHIERLLPVFENGQIEKRHFAKSLNWYKNDHTFQEKNDAFIQCAVQLGKEAIENCLSSDTFLVEKVPYDEIDAIIAITSTGILTPSIEARIMNILPFSPHTKRIPIWGLGCAGGASGLSRAYEYCLAFPNSKVLVLSIELCSLTFQKDDYSKSNFVGTSLFADGAACALVCGDASNYQIYNKRPAVPKIMSTHSTLMKDSLDVMGWELKEKGLHVVFSRSIPTIIEQWLEPNVLQFLESCNVTMSDIHHFIAHPGGKKVLEAYSKALNLADDMTDVSLRVLKNYGNMSSVTILFVLKRFMEIANNGELGLAVALGPGFSSELLLMRWD
ncbi:3-oxoacyl-[acyl-carrier-protein] synthase III C-terminal domain-containing protein [Bacillus sp. B15-48]|uniref:type III polyketide synthase n=1 Tax=Bacillus sp. B15-48 TaxID=1548601 RepID=UPI00193F0479|nr:3-oxoacyl-[acyl-carrier-protein] synthase III C-terminal domain-containing protein [Bacillus sp. B15-48]MBM4762067.1 type III polyketide synthase [Bacillus sp. B15-48]